MAAAGSRKPKVFSDMATSVQSMENDFNKMFRSLKMWGAASVRGMALGPRTVPDPKLMLSKYC